MRVVELNLKVVSTNLLYGHNRKTGKRYKKKDAREFEEKARMLLNIHANRIRLPEDSLDLELITRIYVSRKFDTSNCLKLLEDCIAKHFRINDRRFAGHRTSRVVVKRGEEKIRFKILPYDDSLFAI